MENITNQLNRKSNNNYKLKSYMKKHWSLYFLLLFPITFFLVFRYIPMTYIQVAFKEFNITKNVWSMDWVGWRYFIQAFSNRDFLFALRNTIVLNLLDLLVGFPAPIFLAILLNELPFPRFKRFTQTVVYMPHFLSWIIISGLALQLFAPTSGFISLWLVKVGASPIPFLSEPTYWIVYYIMLGVWQSVGWNTIIYLAAITGINPELYEAASVDGAGRYRKLWHITLPGLKPTIVTLLIMSLGRILGSEFDRPFSLRNSLVSNVSDVIATFVYTNGVRGLQFSLTTAVGLFQSVICVIFLFGANAFAKKMGERGVW